MNSFPDTKRDCCPRCKKSYNNAFTMSWWTEEYICLPCANAESPIKQTLRELGYPDALEGCRYIPNPDNLKAS